MSIYSFVGDESLKNIFYLSAEEAVKHHDYDKYLKVLSKAIKDKEVSLATVESHLIGTAMSSTLRRKIIYDLKSIKYSCKSDIEDLLEYLNPMSKSELDNLLSDTPKIFKDCISYFSDKIVTGGAKAKDVKDFLSERVSS